jgi:hypothetical protein
MTGNSDMEVMEPHDAGHSLSLDGLPASALKAIIAKLNERSQSST